MKSIVIAKKARKTNPSRDYFGLTSIDKCYIGEKSVNLVINRESALVLTEKILRAVNAGKRGSI